MMRCLRAVNVDNNTVGWYQSAYLSNFLTPQLLEVQYGYQKTIPTSVVVVVDPYRTSSGRLSIHAFRLSDDFMNLYASKKFSLERCGGLGAQMDAHRRAVRVASSCRIAPSCPHACRPPLVRTLVDTCLFPCARAAASRMQTSLPRVFWRSCR